MNIATFGRGGPLAIAAALAIAPLPSLAASASASLTNISLSVVDLDLTDGITAGFSFMDGASRVVARFTADNDIPLSRNSFQVIDLE